MKKTLCLLSFVLCLALSFIACERLPERPFANETSKTIITATILYGEEEYPLNDEERSAFVSLLNDLTLLKETDLTTIDGDDFWRMKISRQNGKTILLDFPAPYVEIDGKGYCAEGAGNIQKFISNLLKEKTAF